MVRKKHLIIGAGAAALSALEEIRRVTSVDEVKLVTWEDCLPYSPAGLPYLLSGRIAEAQLWRRDENYFRGLKSILVRGKEVTLIIPEQQQVIYRDGAKESYDTLLIATGAAPTRPPIQGLEEIGVHDFRTLNDCRSLLRQLTGQSKVAILGAGIAGMNLAAALLAKGCRVNIIEKAPKILPLCFPAEAADYIRDIFIAHNARIFTGCAVTAVGRKDGEIKIAFAHGDSLVVDILINATGAGSRVSFLEGTGIGSPEGILVDERMMTGIDGIYAAGDVAAARDFFMGKQRVSAIIPSAVSQGRVAGANMAGGEAVYEGGIPLTAFHFFGNRAFAIGLSAPPDQAGQIWKQKDDQAKRFKELVFAGDRLVGGMFVNEPVDPGVILALIKGRVDMTPHMEALFEGTKPLADPWLSSLKFSVHGSLR